MTSSEEHAGRRVWLLLTMAVLTGLVDATSFLGLGRVFVANMTGNVVFLAFALAGAPGLSADLSALALAGFLTGAALAGRIGRRWLPEQGWLLVGLAVQVLLLGAALLAAAVTGAVHPGFLGTGIAESGPGGSSGHLRYVVVVPLALATGLAAACLLAAATGLLSEA
ncbi:YoaK family protein [Frankia sp. AiPa1]|uniref:YoaK family protein n=1 Tax=Frankia sp. AiPa1 TaxID=573492 RepID=UPI00202AC279|nr:YoaK family protein [Frankia sp. AiPa1]MCL9759378.1 DUF1275 domain-containing protein [Frankia sp. AiPa1]